MRLLHSKKLILVYRKYSISNMLKSYLTILTYNFNTKLFLLILFLYFFLSPLLYSYSDNLDMTQELIVNL